MMSEIPKPQGESFLVMTEAQYNKLTKVDPENPEDAEFLRAMGIKLNSGPLKVQVGKFFFDVCTDKEDFGTEIIPEMKEFPREKKEEKKISQEEREEIINRVKRAHNVLKEIMELHNADSELLNSKDFLFEIEKIASFLSGKKQEDELTLKLGSDAENKSEEIISLEDKRMILDRVELVQGLLRRLIEMDEADSEQLKREGLKSAIERVAKRLSGE